MLRRNLIQTLGIGGLCSLVPFGTQLLNKEEKSFKKGNTTSYVDEDGYVYKEIMKDDNVENISYYNKQGLLHRNGDLPANETTNNLRTIKSWYQNGKLHRDNDLPAVMSGTDKSWYQNGVLHRANGPAYIYDYGYDKGEMWHIEGQLHRIDGPALMTTHYIHWYKNGRLHRDNDLPAVETLDGKKWYKNGLLHRDNDLPAIEKSDGREEWYTNGRLIRIRGAFQEGNYN